MQIAIASLTLSNEMGFNYDLIKTKWELSGLYLINGPSS